MLLNFGDEFEIDILAAGQHTSHSGKKVGLSTEDLAQVAESYDPQRFRAPLIVTSPAHSVPAPDKEAHAAEFAYGTPNSLRVVGNKLRASFKKISPKFVDWAREGKILNVSSSLYPPGHSGNPTPGKYALRHIAGLGATPPAIKDLAPLSLSEWDEAEGGVLNFGEFETGDETDCLEFSFGGGLISDVMTKLRDHLVEKMGAEEADKIIPSYALGSLAQNSDFDYLQEQIRGLRKQIDGMLEGDRSPSPANYSEETMPKETETKATETVDLSEQQAELDRRAAALDKREADARRKEFENFCESELKGKLIPAIAPTSEVVDFMEHLVNPADALSFSEEGKADAQPLEWFKNLLSKLPKQVDFGEAAGGEAPKDEDAENFSEKDKAYDDKADYYAQNSEA